MGYRLVAVDMDGTLLDDRKKISESTIAAVQNIQNNGVVFVIATGRPVQGVQLYMEQLGLTGPVIAYNGAEIFRADTGEIIHRERILSEDAYHAIGMGMEYGVTVCAWANDRLYVTDKSSRILSYAAIYGEDPILLTDENMDEVIESGITTILWFDTIENLAMLTEELNDLAEQQECFQELTYCASDPFFLEMFNSNASKARAMEIIGELYGISDHEMVAIGDGMNDMEMIQYAGLGVAMENAVEELKAVADYVTKSNREDGVAHVLEHLAELP